MHKVAIWLCLCIALLIVFCGNKDNTERLATYLQEEKRLREKLLAPTVLDDSLKILKQRYRININEEWSRLDRDPNEWVTLLRKLTSD